VITPEIAEKLIELVHQTNIAEVFEILSNEGINTPEINYLRREFIHGNHPYSFFERLQVHINEIAQTNIEFKPPRFDIFFSFSSKNTAEAKPIVQNLRREGLSVFFSDEELKKSAGTNFVSKINEALADCQQFILFASPESMESRFVEAEWSYFYRQKYLKDEKKHPLFVVKPKNFKSEIIPPLLQNIQQSTPEDLIQFYKNQNTDFRKKYEQISKEKELQEFEYQKLENEKINLTEKLAQSQKTIVELNQKVKDAEKKIAELESQIFFFKRIQDEYGGQEFIETVQNIFFKMIYIKGGAFMMGNEAGSKSEKPVHKVILDDFMLAETEVTQELYETIMGNNPSHFQYFSTYPVENISWYDAQEFIRKLNKLTGKKYGLPTESQWEYSARGGKYKESFKYSGSNNLDAIAWYRRNSEYTIHPVKTKQPNILGLYDMNGNVREWCSDYYDSNFYGFRYRIKNSNNPNNQSNTNNNFRVLRGGSWNNTSKFCQVTSRYGIRADFCDCVNGFRLAHPL